MLAVWRSHPSQRGIYSCVGIPSNSSRNRPRNGVVWDNLILAERFGFLNPFNLYYISPEWFIIVSWKCVLMCTVPRTRLTEIRELRSKLWRNFTVSLSSESCSNTAPFFRIKTFILLRVQARYAENTNCSSKESLSRMIWKKRKIHISTSHDCKIFWENLSCFNINNCSLNLSSSRNLAVIAKKWLRYV